MLLPKWQMLLPYNRLIFWPCGRWNTAYVTAVKCDCGRWNGHLLFGWCYCHGRWNSHIGWNGLGRCFCLVADVIPQGHYFSLSSMLLIRTSSQMCGRWYLPMFLLRDGLLTLMNIDSLISLERLCSSMPTILKLFNVMLWPEVLQWSWIGEGATRQ